MDELERKKNAERRAQEQREKLERFRYLNRFAKKGQIVFAGSSLMEQFPIYEFIQDFDIPMTIYNRGIGGYKTEDLLNAMDTCVFELEPSVLMLSIGTNDLNSADTSLMRLYENCSRILSMTRERLPETRIVWLGFYPVNADAAGEVWVREQLKYRTNALIGEANRSLKTIAEKYDAAFLDVNSLLMDHEGRLKAEYTIDGIHMYANGYREILEQVVEALRA